MNAVRAASIHARLLNLARARGEDFSPLLNRYAVERWLYRLAQSEQRERLWLKGALLFQLWFDVPHRLTRDADFLGIGPADAREFGRRRTQIRLRGVNYLEGTAQDNCRAPYDR
jgi:hypothetical protein